MRRRHFIACLGGAAAMAVPLAPRVAHPQQRALPVIGILNAGTANEATLNASAFKEGLGAMGYVEGRNVAIVYRWAEGEYERLPELAMDLVRRPVAVIAALSTPAALAAKQVTTNIPIAFVIGTDPVKAGLVASLNRPGGNITGFTDFANQLWAKRLGLMLDAVPGATLVAVLVNPRNPVAVDTTELEAAAATRGVALQVISASNESDAEIALARVRTQSNQSQ